MRPIIKTCLPSLGWICLTLLAISVDCLTNQVRVLHFLEHNTTVGELGSTIIQPRPSKNLSTGFTVCLRANFKIWTSRRLVQIKSEDHQLGLRINDHQSGYLVLDHFVIADFDLGSSANLSPFAWNMFCLTYNETDRNVMITINGERVFDKKQLGTNFSTPSVLWKDRSRSALNITDLNLWSRPLTLNEIGSLLHDCDQDVIGQNQPEHIYWVETSIFTNDSYFYDSTEKFSEMCDQTGLQTLQNFLFPLQVHFSEALSYCDLFNADFPQISNFKEFKTMLDATQGNVYNSCATFWVPANRSRVNTKQFIQASNQYNGSLVSLDDQFNVDTALECLLFKKDTKDFQPADCTNLGYVNRA